ncbi:hypothetical protein [Duganella sp. 1411]|uniref:hypothetical protein n=1 Tax=Duganella sp. 1411 TaxID=2806572 RepID=UPI0035A6B132
MPNLSSVVCGLLLQLTITADMRAKTADPTQPSPMTATVGPISEEIATRPANAALVRRLYEAAGNETIWLGAERRQAERALALLRSAPEHGLSPAHYRVEELTQPAGRPGSRRRRWQRTAIFGRARGSRQTFPVTPWLGGRW